jgi:hypothetical protein
VLIEEMFIYRHACGRNVCFLDVRLEEILASAAVSLF